MVVPSILNLFGIQFHMYGLIVGIAIVVCFELSQKLISQTKYSVQLFHNYTIWIGLGALVGARLWHVFTDWYVYQENILTALEIWNGGLSIIGAIMGAAGALSMVQAIRSWLQLGVIPIAVLADVAALSVPVAQAIGRVANYMNQELYGLPTNLLWGLYIEPHRRLPGYESIEYYHPLFAYEAIASAMFASILWILYKSQPKRLQFGSGKLFLYYGLFYAVLRFFLEFIRIETAQSGVWILSINQIVLVIWIVLGATSLHIFRLENR